jgi:pyruvate kinase
MTTRIDLAADHARRGTPDRLLTELLALRADVVSEADELVERWRPALARRAFLPSAVNLARYISLRHRDLRAVQEELMPLGLSSLGRCEARVLENLDAVIASLAAVTGDATRRGAIRHPRPASFFRGSRLLRRHTDAVFGPPPPGRRVRIMVTLPSEASGDYGLVRDLIADGADLVRINCAHDTPDAWTAMAAHARRAAEESGRSCRVLIDLEGPRARMGRVVGPDDEVRVAVGDLLRLVAEAPQGRPDPAQVECSLPEAVAQLKTGDRVFVDEGRIRLVVETPGPHGALLRVTRVESKGRVRPDKGLNFPDTDLHLDPLTPKDLEDLDLVAQEADIVGYSFVQSAADMARLQDELSQRAPRASQAIVAKIETQLALRHLPEIIVQGAGRQPLAVMIARGDLAVEIGFSRLAEMQEEILWLCEAAHVPVIWATQVLDGFVHKGTHSRAEMTDVAMAERAECVMLNKGPYLLNAVGVLDDVLIRMEAHQSKKTSRLRALSVW